MPSILNATTTNGLVTSADNSGSLQLQTNNGTTAVTIDTSQRAAFVAGTAALPAITTSGDTNTGIYFPAADTIAFSEGGTEQMRLTSTGDLQMNSGYGSVATAYGCRAWVNFNGQGTVAIRASGNVSSITDNATGRYTLNLSTALPDVNFALAGNASFRDSTDDGNSGVVAIRRLNSVSITTTAIPIQTTYYGANGTLDDFPFINAMVIR